MTNILIIRVIDLFIKVWPPRKGAIFSKVYRSADDIFRCRRIGTKLTMGVAKVCILYTIMRAMSTNCYHCYLAIGWIPVFVILLKVNSTIIKTFYSCRVQLLYRHDYIYCLSFLSILSNLPMLFICKTKVLIDCTYIKMWT